MNYYKFSECAIPEDDFIKQYYNNIQSNVKEFLKDIISKRLVFGHYDIINGGYYKIRGWLIDFRSELNKYLVRFSYGDYAIYYSLNKTLLRKALSSVSKIIEIPKDF